MIESHQNLLEKYYEQGRKVIFEYSGDIDFDIGELIGEIRAYAGNNGLDSSFTDADIFDDYTRRLDD